MNRLNSRINRYREAFKEDFNLAGLAAAVALSAVTLNPLPLLVGLVAEAAYILFVPDSQWFQNRLAKRYDHEIQRHRENLKKGVLPKVRPTIRERFARLEITRKQIESQPFEMSEDRWFREVLRKLDYLLEKYLQFASKEADFRNYVYSIRETMREEARPSEYDEPEVKIRDRRRGREQQENSTPDFIPPAPLDLDDRWIQRNVQTIQESYEREMRNVQTLLDKEADFATKNVLEKRLSVLQKRTEFISKINTILTNLNHQLQLLEDTFGLINDQIRARSPEQVLSDIDDVVIQTDTMTQVLEELAPYEQLVARLS
jgi:hypothetical protein